MTDGSEITTSKRGFDSGRHTIAAHVASASRFVNEMPQRARSGGDDSIEAAAGFAREGGAR